ncbi:MAG TPA: glycosyltransferase, partial [Jatrophihabitans sp.]|nr:glycosyltransferase [Jatrophihabitans sp.]
AVRDGSGAQRRRALVAGYACGPGDESEAAAGWALARAAATSYDVWLITRPRFAPAITAALAAEPELAAHLVPIYLDLSAAVLRFKRRPRDVYWYYVLWQWALGRRARDLHAHIRFDVAHHATFAADWLPCGLTRLRGVPLVWGPVGGASYLRWSLAPWLGPRGVLSELARSIGTRVARAVWGDRAARRAAVVVAQNGDVAARFATHARQVVVEPNAALEPAEPRRSRDGHGEYREAVFVGRLVPWKGCRLALDALARPEAAGWRLDVYGAGPDAAALSARTRRLGLAERVSFHGWRPRAEVLDAFTRADALLFPSMHDSAGWAVAEASAVGCPVVCLDIGGPPLLAGPNGHVAAPSRDVVRALARALETAGTAARIGYPRWSAQRLPALVQDWYRDAIASTTDGGA